MLKKYNGVTLVLLVIIIIVMMILLGITGVTSTKLIKDSKLKKCVTTMQLVQAKVINIYESYNFNEDNNILIGIKANTSEVEACDETNNADDLWYKWDSEAALEQGIETDLLNGGGYFLVNYKTEDILYSKGISTDAGVLYSLEKMKEL